jgi:hypothetical protein
VWRSISAGRFQTCGTMQPRVFSPVNNTHPTTAEFLDNAVVRDCLADERVTA